MRWISALKGDARQLHQRIDDESPVTDPLKSRECLETKVACPSIVPIFSSVRREVGETISDSPRVSSDPAGFQCFLMQDSSSLDVSFQRREDSEIGKQHRNASWGVQSSPDRQTLFEQWFGPGCVAGS